MPRKSVWQKGDLSKTSPEAWAEIQKYAHEINASHRGMKVLAIVAEHVMAQKPKTPKPSGKPKDGSRYDLGVRAKQLHAETKSWTRTPKKMNQEFGKKKAASTYRAMLSLASLQK
jgi:hypothetical protein